MINDEKQNNKIDENNFIHGITSAMITRLQVEAIWNTNKLISILQITIKSYSHVHFIKKKLNVMGQMKYDD